MKNYVAWLIALFVAILFSPFFGFAASNNPVVQIVGYDAVGGRYPNMLGWGSASIISKDGLILTNNHVVDNGRGGTLPGFSICVSVDDTQRPVCHYTARLIARDIRRDVAVLRIDSVDIFGKSVDFSRFAVMDIDYSYIPKAQDTVVAIGYPWVGANTITKTQGVVAGTQPYNDVTYVKTDALIAGGNSGGPLVYNGKMIGINTFGIGGGFDSSLGYALSVQEVKEFVMSSVTKSASPISPTLGFSEYLRRLETINLERLVSDRFVSMKFDTSYKVTHYIPDLQIRGEISNPDNYHVQQFNIQRVNLPKFATIKEQEYFLKNQMQLYGGWRWSEKLKIKKIGGLDFYEPIFEADPSGGEGYGYKKYFTIVDGTMVIITLYAPLGNENTQEQVKQNIDMFLSRISFGAINTLPRQDFTLYSPAISLSGSDQSFVDIFGQINWGFNEGYGWSSNYVRYLGNLYEKISLSISPNTLYGGKGKNAQQLLDAALASTYGNTIQSKGLVNYYGNDGYMICSEDQRNTSVDPQGRTYKLISCSMNVVVGLKQDDVISITLYTTQSSFESNKKQFFVFADSILKPLGDASKGVTIAPELQQSESIVYRDIADQDITFQKMLNRLMSWGILKKNTLFNGDYLLTWGDFSKLYLKMVYNKNLTDLWSGSITYGSLLLQLPYDQSSLVPSSQVSYFETMLKIKLAGVGYDDFSEYGLSRFERLKDTTYKPQRDRIQEWEYKIYGNRRIDQYEAFGSVGSWYSNKTFSYNPLTKNISQSLYHNTAQLWLSSGVTISAIENTKFGLYCNSQPSVSQDCLQYWNNQLISSLSYTVFTKGDAINYLVGKIDIGLFDSYWAKKKETQIEHATVD